LVGFARKVLKSPLALSVKEKIFPAKAQRRKENRWKRGSALRLCGRDHLRLKVLFGQSRFGLVNQKTNDLLTRRRLFLTSK